MSDEITHVYFDAYYMLEEPIPANSTREEIAQAIQNELGFSGIQVSTAIADRNKSLL